MSSANERIKKNISRTVYLSKQNRCSNGVNIIVHVNNRELSVESITQANRIYSLSQSLFCASLCVLCACWHFIPHFTLEIYERKNYSPNLNHSALYVFEPGYRSIYFAWIDKSHENLTDELDESHMHTHEIFYVCFVWYVDWFLLNIHVFVVVVQCMVRWRVWFAVALLLLKISTFEITKSTYNHKWTQKRTLEHFTLNEKRRQIKQQKSSRHHISKSSRPQQKQRMCSAYVFY